MREGGVAWEGARGSRAAPLGGNLTGKDPAIVDECSVACCPARESMPPAPCAGSSVACCLSCAWHAALATVQHRAARVAMAAARPPGRAVTAHTREPDGDGRVSASAPPAGPLPRWRPGGPGAGRGPGASHWPDQVDSDMELDPQEDPAGARPVGWADAAPQRRDPRKHPPARAAAAAQVQPLPHPPAARARRLAAPPAEAPPGGRAAA